MQPAISALGSEPAIRLAAELAERAPGDLNHIYFTLGGSDAVDSTIRFIRYYYHAKGSPKRRPVHFGRAGLSWFLDGRRRPNGPAGLPCRFRGSAMTGSIRFRSRYAYRNPVGSGSAGHHRCIAGGAAGKDR